MTGTNFPNYPSLSGTPAPADTVLLLRLADTSASSQGTVHQATVTQLSEGTQPSVLNLGALGGTGTNTSADTTLIQSVISGAPAGSTILFDKLYTVNAVIQMAGDLTYQGVNQQTGLQMADSANLDALMAPVGWDNNTMSTGTQPVTIRDMAFYGPPTVPQASGDGHLLVFSAFWSYIEDCLFSSTIGEGIRFDGCTANNTQVLGIGGAVQNRVSRCQFYHCLESPVHSNDPGGAFTDGFITDCIFEGVTSSLSDIIGLESLAGWEISGNHFFGAGASCISGKTFMTKVTGNYFEPWGLCATSGSYAAVDFSENPTSDVGNGSVIANNVMYTGTPGNAGSSVTGIAVTAASGGEANVAVTGNQLSGKVNTGGFYTPIWLLGADSTAALTAYVAGNNVTGLWNFSQVSTSNNDSSPTTNITVNGDSCEWTVRLGAAFNSGTGTSAQTVTGMAAALLPGNYEVTAWVPMTPHGTTGSTQSLAWTFSGTASSAVAAWKVTGAGSGVTSGVSTTLTTASPVSPVMTSTGLTGEFSGHLVVSAAGTLQLTVTSGASGDECTIPLGARVTVRPVAL